MKNHTLYNAIGGLFLLFSAFTTHAQTTIYSIRVDGLACPYCAYGIEKKLNKINGITFIDMDLDKGIVTVKAKDTVLTDPQLKQLFTDSGFTYRTKKKSLKIEK
ncbi:Lead, cadmium, zinc and mercury transporting ATPase; Copper-translocating P-type ATPase [hydrothermal vent metagenome]|uniref:Lead, cadmium, zinc and mercury transporting ATPase Copper-translocating P-type ATPase n=1 Tax=hydrothermal vent metagenome TaxID=652676 RepID=A0A3B0WYL2_9ZZZZ